MIVDIRPEENIALLKPGSRISETDIEAVKHAINSYSNDYDKVPNLVIEANSAPLWEDLASLRAHIEFVEERHTLIKKVAIVTDSTLISLVRPLVDVFTGAKVRRFKTEALDDAINWAQIEEDHPGDIVPIDGLPRDVIAVRMAGIITSQDYTDTLMPMVSAAAAEHDKVKLLVLLDQYFDGYSAGAMWDDMRLGFSHLNTFSKVAIVTEEEWIRKGAKLFGALMPAEVMVFDLEDLEDAKSWIRS